MSQTRKIGLIACTGVVAGNMMGSGIALLPANLAAIGGISLWGWVISLIGAMSLAYVYARLATKIRSKEGRLLMQVNSLRHLVFRPECCITMQTGLVTLPSVLRRYPTCQLFSHLVSADPGRYCLYCCSMDFHVY